MIFTLTQGNADIAPKPENLLEPHPFDLEYYGISRKTGFLPETPPLTRLHAYFEPWETLLDELPHYLKNETYRGMVLKLPLLRIEELPDLPSKRRAFTVLTFLSSAYIWGYHLTQPPLHILPFSLAQPLTQLAALLGLQPISCYTTVSLWNFRVSKLDDLESLHSLHGFTGTEDESWFYMVPLAIEIASTPCIQAILDAFEAMRCHQNDKLSTALEVAHAALDKVLAVLPQMSLKCNPSIFFNIIRPFLAGWSHIPASPHHPHGGVLFEHVHDMPAHWLSIHTPKGSIVRCNGGSAGQTPTIQLLDAFLGIRHASKMYYEMRDYIPLGFQQFIHFVESHEPSLKTYLLESQVAQLKEQFNGLIEKMTSFRNIHLKMVAQYIVSQQYKGGLGCSKLPSSSSRVNELKGTGNTQLMPFLKETRDETKNSLLENPSTETL